MLFDSLRKRLDVVFTRIVPKVTLLTPVDDVKDGILTKRSEFQVFDIASSLMNFSSVDFDVVSLEAVGALSKLQTTVLISKSDMSIADSFENYSITEPNS